jgi:hypothetical protein
MSLHAGAVTASFGLAKLAAGEPGMRSFAVST